MTVWVSGLRFPLQSGPAFLNSQVYRYNDGGFQASWIGPDGAVMGAANTSPAQCDTRNYSFPWQDTFCEERPGGGGATNMLCNSGAGHQGIDIRGPVCATNNSANAVVTVAAGKIITIKPHYTKQMLPDGSTYFSYFHMHMPTRAFNEAALQSAGPGGIPVTRGQFLGNIGNIQAGTIDGTITAYTTRHLHVELRMNFIDPDTGEVLTNIPVSPYATLKDAYLRLQSSTP